MVGRPRNMELLAQNGANVFDLDLLDKPGGTAIQPSRNNDENDVFSPTTSGQDDPADFLAPVVKIWDEGTSSLITPPGGYNPPAVSGLVYGGVTGRFLVTLTGSNTRLTSALVNQRWALQWPTQVNGTDFAPYEFFTVLSDGDAAFGDEGHEYADPDVLATSCGITYADLGLASQGELDEFILEMNHRASAIIDRLAGHDFLPHEAINEAYDGKDRRSLILRGWPVISLTDVQEDGVSLDGTDYRLKKGDYDTNCGVLERKDFQPWTCSWQKWTVSYTYGYATVPKDIASVAEAMVCRFLTMAAASYAKAQSDALGVDSWSMDGFAVSYASQNSMESTMTDHESSVVSSYRVGA